MVVKSTSESTVTSCVAETGSSLLFPYLLLPKWRIQRPGAGTLTTGWMNVASGHHPPFFAPVSLIMRTCYLLSKMTESKFHEVRNSIFFTAVSQYLEECLAYSRHCKKAVDKRYIQKYHDTFNGTDAEKMWKYVFMKWIRLQTTERLSDS